MQLASFFVDHVCENEKKQDRVFTASIFEALMYRIRLQVPQGKQVVICTDNSRNYNNNVLPIYVPWICDAYNFELTTLLHPDECCGKSCVDCHFAVSFRLLKRYVMESKFDVLTPEDIVDALRYEGGIRNTLVDYVRVIRKFKTILEYECSEKVNLVGNLVSTCDIQYERIEEGKYMMKCFKYSGAHYRVFSINNHESIVILNYAEQTSVERETY